MARPQRLDEASIENILRDAPLWERRDEHLFRSFRFTNFVVAFDFMTQLAVVAESLDHHPEWTNVYGRVDIAMTTHDAGGITELDARFVAEADRIAAALSD